MMLRTLVVDDEPIPRRLLCSMISTVDGLELIGEAKNGQAAVDMIDAHEPDLVFLDVKLPDFSGIEVLERSAFRPEVVFTTAYDEYAIRALQLGALDYLLKPFGRTRFLEAIQRVRERIASSVRDRDTSDESRVPARQRPAKRIYVRDRDSMIPVTLDRVERIEAQGDQSALRIQNRMLVAQLGLGELEPLLDPERFVRVHRSHIVNLDHVAALRPYDERRLAVVMKDGFQVVASRSGTRLLRGRIL
jgi:two-component system, LytTR family, response regulator